MPKTLLWSQKRAELQPTPKKKKTQSARKTGTAGEAQRINRVQQQRETPLAALGATVWPTDISSLPVHFAPPGERQRCSPCCPLVHVFVYYVAHSSSDLYTHTHTHTHTHARTHARTHTHTHARTHARTHTYTHTHARARAHARTHTHTHTHTHTYTHKYVTRRDSLFLLFIDEE